MGEPHLNIRPDGVIDTTGTAPTLWGSVIRLQKDVEQLKRFQYLSTGAILMLQFLIGAIVLGSHR